MSVKEFSSKLRDQVLVTSIFSPDDHLATPLLWVFDHFDFLSPNSKSWLEIRL